MKRIFTLTALTAFLLTGCGAMTESGDEITLMPAGLAAQQDHSISETAVVSEQPRVEIAAEPHDFDSITDEQVLERLYSPLSNTDYIPDFYTPGYFFNYSIPPEAGDPVRDLQSEEPNSPMELQDENELYSVYSFPERDALPTILLKQLRQAGNGYVYYDGELDEASVLANFDLIAHEKKLLDRWYKDDPEIKCVAYEFYAVEEIDENTAELGWYCYLIDRNDHMVSLTPEWNQKRTISLTGDKPETTEPDSFTDEELDAMQEVDEALDVLLDSDEWKQADTGTRRAMAVDFLNELADKGLILPESIVSSEDYVHFSYASGAGGGIKLTPFDPRMN